MDIQQLLAQATDSVTVKRVFGEPIERDGILVVPVARVRGGAGGGDGSEADKGSGSGGGFMVHATAAGVYVVKGDHVAWKPAVDVTRIALGGQLVGVVLILALRSILRRR